MNPLYCKSESESHNAGGHDSANGELAAFPLRNHIYERNRSSTHQTFPSQHCIQPCKFPSGLSATECPLVHVALRGRTQSGGSLPGTGGPRLPLRVAWTSLPLVERLLSCYNSDVTAGAQLVFSPTLDSSFWGEWRRKSAGCRWRQIWEGGKRFIPSAQEGRDDQFLLHTVLFLHLSK
ncbi:Transport And Golgi Organization Protein 1-like [Manis pentadactyla]|nr:Transport And Golgi Organization Protein 1-like [Manis pentadactyla]